MINSLVQTLNVWGAQALDIAWPMLWQSSLLIVLLFLLDLAIRRRVRAAVRYGLWLVVLLKLMLPPSLALPTGAAWWLRSNTTPLGTKPQRQTYVVSYARDTTPLPAQKIPAASLFIAPPKLHLS